ncbi:MAG: hypothetical protein OEY06_13690, partial [Gammaproteobacteria bacterium]|nr:hypothetical protein [Gammaproteobacteria bacterium]
KAPSIPYREFVETEVRFNMLWRTHPDVAEKLLEESQQDVLHRYHYYEQLANLPWDDTGATQTPRRKLVTEVKQQSETKKQEQPHD